MVGRINQSPSSISRAVTKRKDDYNPYWYDWAQKYAEQRKVQPTCEKRKSHQPLYDLYQVYVLESSCGTLLIALIKYNSAASLIDNKLQQ